MNSIVNSVMNSNLRGYMKTLFDLESPLSLSRDIDIIVASYIEAALWTEEDRLIETYGNAIMDITIHDFSVSEIIELRELVIDFANHVFEMLTHAQRIQYARLDPAQIGHDLWLTRNRHGSGFWDRGLGDLGQVLTKCAHSYGEAYLEIDSNGRPYFA